MIRYRRSTFVNSKYLPGILLIILLALVALPLARDDRVYAQTITGTPWTRHTIDASARGADGVRVADVNGDGFLDIATAWEESKRVFVYLNPGPQAAKGLWPKVQAGNTQVCCPEDAVFADLDNDGSFDVISSSEAHQLNIHWAPSDSAQYLNAAAWQIQPIPSASGVTKWMYSVPLQLDGVNGPDIIAGGKEIPSKVGWFEAPTNARDMSSWLWHPIADVGWTMSLIPNDMDGDGNVDIVVSDKEGLTKGLSWLRNPGIGPAQALPWERIPIVQGVKAGFATLADIDGDGLVDAATANEFLNSVTWSRRLATNGRSWQSYSIPTANGTKGVAVGDINLDGKLDLVVTCLCDNVTGGIGVYWMSYQDSPTNTNWSAFNIGGTEGVKFDRIELIDLDGDGDLDVLTTEERTGLGVIWYENPTISPGGSTPSPTPTPGAPAPNPTPTGTPGAPTSSPTPTPTPGGSAASSTPTPTTTPTATPSPTPTPSGDFTPPTISLTNPVNGAYLAKIKTIAANAQDNTGVTKVEFYVDGSFLASDISSPYSTSWDTRTSTNGTHTVFAKAFDAAGNSSVTNAITVTVDNSNPVISITTPTDGSTIFGMTAITVDASDNAAVAKVQFYVDGLLRSTDTVAPYSFNLDTTTLVNGSHTVSAKAVDKANNVASAAITVIVGN